MLHGLQDNANTFDYLVCKLPYEYYYVSVDLPGHGKSDNLPSQGLPLQVMHYVYVIKLLVDHFKREKYIIIGHSFGALLGMQYALVYPEKLDKLFILDSIWHELVNPSDFGSWIRNKFENVAKTLLQLPRLTTAEFTYDECRDLLFNWRFSDCELTPKATEALLRRSVEPCGNGKYKFTRDPKLKYYIHYPMDERYLCAVLNSSNISFKIVVLVTKRREELYANLCPRLVETYKKIGEWRPIDGTHHVHLNDPDIVANVLNEYFDEVIPF